jgi:hypothetical protein
MRALFCVFIMIPLIITGQFKLKNLKFNKNNLERIYENLSECDEKLIFRGFYTSCLIQKLNSVENLYFIDSDKFNNKGTNGFLVSGKDVHIFIKIDFDQFYYDENAPFSLFLYSSDWRLKKIVYVKERRIFGFFNIDLVNEEYILLTYFSCSSRKIIDSNLLDENFLKTHIKKEKIQTMLIVKSDFDIANLSFHFH